MISLVYLPSIANDLTISIQDYLSLRFSLTTVFDYCIISLTSWVSTEIYPEVFRFLYDIECKRENDIPKSNILNIEIYMD